MDERVFNEMVIASGRRVHDLVNDSKNEAKLIHRVFPALDIEYIEDQVDNAATYF